MSSKLSALFALLLTSTTVGQETPPLLEKIDLFEAGQSGFALYRIPGIIVTKKGTVLAYCEARKHGGKDWGEIEVHLRRSIDGGKTWEAPLQIAHQGERIPLTVKTTEGLIEQTVNNPVAINDDNGGVHFLYCVNYARAFYMRSDDDGLSWTSPVEITNAFESFKGDYPWTVIATGPGHGIQAKNGRLIVPVWLSSGKDGAHEPSVAATIYSDDHGQTWKAGEIAVPSSDRFNHPNETVITQLSDGQIMLNSRSNSNANRRIITTSPDGAGNWSAPYFDSALLEPRCMGSLISHPNNGQKPLLIFANPHSIRRDAEFREMPGTSGPRENLSLKVSENDGRTWISSKTLEASGSGYSDLAVLPDGTVLCFYERSRDGLQSVGLLTVARLNLAWLRQAEEIKPTTTMLEAGDAVANRVMNHSTGQSGYMYDLALEGLLELGRVTKDQKYKDYVLNVALKQRNLTPETAVSWRKQPFGCLTYSLFEATGDKAWLPVFTNESQLMVKEIWRNEAGIILHPRGEKRGGGEAMLIDALQEYCTRAARMGKITAGSFWYAECARQFNLYRSVVRYPESGLWSQGRGWLTGRADALSPGAWSRGHGWLIRGMEQSLRYLPKGSGEYKEVQGYLVELADALVDVQRPDGMWSCILTRPQEETPPETSGTALIAYHLARAIYDGHLTDSKYKTAADKAFSALPQYVMDDGTVLSVSPGPGPLETEQPWLKSEYPPGDPHGTFAILFATAGYRLLNP